MANFLRNSDDNDWTTLSKPQLVLWDRHQHQKNVINIPTYLSAFFSEKDHPSLVTLSSILRKDN